MKYQVMCQHLGLASAPASKPYVDKGEIVDEDQLQAEEIPKLLAIGAIAPTEDEAPKTLQDMTRSELDTVAAGLGIDSANMKNRGAVIDAIEAAQASSEEPDDDGEIDLTTLSDEALAKIAEQSNLDVPEGTGRDALITMINAVSKTSTD